MMIEIKGTGFINKGAELMLMAILQKMRERYPHADFVLTPEGNTCTYQDIGRVGCFQKFHFSRRGIDFLKLFEYLPRGWLRRYGLVLDSEIDVVLDASGLAYSDSWGAIPAKITAQSIGRWRKTGKKVIFLPQAFGPFNSEGIKKAMRTIITNADLICARDDESLRYLQQLDAAGAYQHYPDFTNVLSAPELPEKYHSLRGRVCLITNCRMLDQLASEEAARYLPLMLDAVKQLNAAGCKPFILLHEGIQDEALAKQIQAESECALDIIKESDPLIIKSIIGSARGVLCSRFHGLVSALSQGVPALGTGWSHKYQMLFRDYGFSEGLLNLQESSAEVAEKLGFITNPEKNAGLRQQLSSAATIQKQRTEEMWKTVFGIVDSLSLESA